MSLEIYYKEDVLRILASLDVAMGNTAAQSANSDRLMVYREGYRDALRAVAIAFGVLTPEEKEKNADEYHTISQRATSDQIMGSHTRALPAR